MLELFKKNAGLLLFGLLLTFFSGFGQTFLFSLFLPGFQESFALTSGTFGTFYSGVTLLSALILPWSGALIDRVSLKRFALFVVVIMTISGFLISVSHGLVVLFIGMLGVRHTGQALMSHISQTTMARYFDKVRGKALSIAFLGHPLGEAVLPISVALLIGFAGWRMSWAAISVFVLAAGLLLIPVLLRGKENPGPVSGLSENKDGDKKESSTTVPSSTRREMLRDPRFYFIIPAGLASPVIMTGFFLYQVPLAEYKGWSVEWLASCFVGFAISKTIFSLAGGPVIDKISARRVYPFMLLPMMLGFVVLLFGMHPGFAMGYMILLGMTEGVSANTKTAVFAELYGVEHLGAIRSTLVAMMVFSTATAPVVFGNLLDAGISFSEIITGTLVVLVTASLLSLRILPALQRENSSG